MKCSRCEGTLMLADRGALCNPCRQHVSQTGDDATIDRLQIAFNRALDALKTHRDALHLLLKALPKVSIQINGEDHLANLTKLISELEDVK